jgi:hypothetical protein
MNVFSNGAQLVMIIVISISPSSSERHISTGAIDQGKTGVLLRLITSYTTGATLPPSGNDRR